MGCGRSPLSVCPVNAYTRGMLIKKAVVALAICSAFTAPLYAASAGDLAMLFETLRLVSETGDVIEGLKAKNGALPKVSTPLELSHARSGDDAILDLMIDPWGTAFHVESDPAGGYLIVAAGSDRRFDRATWTKPAQTRSTADDIVMRDGTLVRSPVEWAVATAMEAAGDPVTQLERALLLGRHKRTVADLEMIALATEASQLDQKLRPAKSIDELAEALEPTYIRNLPRADAWERPFHVDVDAAGGSYVVVSAGPDGTLDPKSWNDPSRSSDDIVLRDHRIIRNAEAPAAPQAAAADPDLEKARATTAMFEQLAEAIKRYDDEPIPPLEANSRDELARALVPKYAESIPRTDAWGTPLQVRFINSKLHVISAGADRKFDPSRWNDMVITGDYDRDLVLANDWIRSPWDVSDPVDRLTQAFGQFLASRGE